MHYRHSYMTFVAYSIICTMAARDSIHGFMTKTCQYGLWLNQTTL